jgi:hypothetical protein
MSRSQALKFRACIFDKRIWATSNDFGHTVKSLNAEVPFYFYVAILMTHSLDSQALYIKVGTLATLLLCCGGVSAANLGFLTDTPIS